MSDNPTQRFMRRYHYTPDALATAQRHIGEAGPPERAVATLTVAINDDGDMTCVMAGHSLGLAAIAYALRDWGNVSLALDMGEQLVEQGVLHSVAHLLSGERLDDLVIVKASAENVQ